MVMAAVAHEAPRWRRAPVVRDPLGPPAELLEVREVLVVARGRLDLLELRDAGGGPLHLDPARVESGLDQVALLDGVLAALPGPEDPGERIEGHPDAIADP